jgi:hypothetical protein
LKIIIESGASSWQATINETPTGQLIFEALPFKCTANRWGKEIYFSIPVTANLEPGSTNLVSKGDLGYWPTGNAFCIFFGATPISEGNKIVAASAVNIFGRVAGDLESLDNVSDGDEIRVKKA